jgi:ubiquinone/menaquinone biosynthesis C-methylase UbiE
MSKKFDPRKKAMLLTAEREAQMQPRALLTSLGVKPGDVVADVGCGPGFFTIPAAEIVGPDGKVFAADVQSDMIAAMMMRVFETGLRNIEILKASETDVALPHAGVDLILLAFMLHELAQRSCYLFRLRHALRSTGRIAIVEWEADPSSTAPPTENPVTADDLLADARAAGFGLVERRQLLPEYYLLILIAR